MFVGPLRSIEFPAVFYICVKMKTRYNDSLTAKKKFTSTKVKYARQSKMQSKTVCLNRL